ncbi:MAG: 54S ribosomal protein L22, mitochondrial [Bathelium mastoideum]|nr:MAG: 54S ribosomal protein L22, mitochondrial [Bathelium mastoideum]
MSVRLSKQLAEPVAVVKSVSTSSLPYRLRPSIDHVFRRRFTAGQCRLRKDDSMGSKAAGTQTPPPNPLLENYFKRKPSGPPKLVRGDLAPSSIFDEERPRPIEDPSEQEATPKTDTDTHSARPVHDPDAMSAALDPNPDARLRWERKKVIQSIRHRGRISRALALKRTERESLSKSHFFKTSVKKLAPLARQIAGKPVADAIAQMRLSRKKAAIDVVQHLERARDTAVVARGMGLGEVEERKGAPVEIKTKDGKHMVIEDRTGMYIDQAWVGRGPYGKELEFRARGKVNMLHLPSTSLSVVLKEEATRVRQHEEREEKKRKRKVWVQLPDRPITAQRPYYSW